MQKNEPGAVRMNCTDAVYATGKRKSAVSKVWLKPGRGSVVVKRGDKYLSVAEAFPVLEMSRCAMSPLNVLDGAAGKLDVLCIPHGGGISGQAGAISNGIAKALVKYNDKVCRPILREAGLMTRDARIVEPKKPGLTKARKKAQRAKR